MDNRNTAWLRDTVRQTSRGKSAAAGRTTGPPRSLTSLGTSAWPYRVTTQYSFYPVQMYLVNTTKVKLWNYKSNDLPANGLPTRAWSRQPSHQLDKVSEGRRPEHLLNNPGLYLTYNCHPQYIWGYFAEKWNKSHWILQRIYRLTVCNSRAFALSRRCRVSRRAFALSRRCWVSRSRPRVFHETITVISLWRHYSGPWDNAESIAAHSNAIPKTMGRITI